MVHNPSTRLKQIAINLYITRSVLLISAQTADEHCIYGDAGGVDGGGAQWGVGNLAAAEVGVLAGFLREK